MWRGFIHFSFAIMAGKCMSFVSVSSKMNNLRPWKGVKTCANLITPAKICKLFVQNKGWWHKWMHTDQVNHSLIYRLGATSGTAILCTNEYDIRISVFPPDVHQR